LPVANIQHQIEQKAGEMGVDWPETEKAVLIRSIDTLWVEHLEAMASVRQGIGLRGYGQRDPLIEYKKEAYRQFGELNSLIQREVVYSVFKVAKNLENLSFPKKLKLKTKHIRIPFLWSEDFGLFSSHTKTLLFGLGSGKTQPQLHEPNFDFPDELIPTGVSMFWEIIEQIHN
jgi:metal-dependent amidase/aminoacylase/carboxypeptidase family protein